MANNGSLRRDKSLKNSPSSQWSKRERIEEEDEPLPARPLKHTFVQCHVTSDDLAIARSPLPLRPQVQRYTWPTSLQDKKPGSYFFHETPTLIRTPWEAERSRRPASHGSRRSSERGAFPFGLFDQLPVEVLHCVLDQLNSAHYVGSSWHVKNHHDDLRALCLSSKRWNTFARERLYSEICAPSNATAMQKQRVFARRHTGLLQLLLRTLKGSQALADTVRRIHVSARLASELECEKASTRSSRSKNTAVTVLGDVISRCRNLEHLDGYVPDAVNSASKLFAALSTCSKLKSHVWRLSPDELNTESMLRTTDFVTLHADWRQLQTLVLWQNSNGDNLPQGSVNAITQRLPSLERLMVRCLHPLDFHNGTLLMLPPLRHLRLEEVHGVTDQGLEQLAQSRLAFSLEGLTLCGLELTSLRTMQTLFSGLVHLQKFTLHQDTSPELQQSYTVTSNNFSLGSPTLQYLHWDVIAPGHSTTILANSIAAGKFPSLGTVKVPCDYDGAIQNLCRPILREPIGNTDLRRLEEWDSRSRYQRSLRVSQIQAQLRIRQSRRQPLFNVVVQDEHETIQREHSIGSFVGNMASKIEYSLEPAIEGTGVAIAQIDTVCMPQRAKLGQRTNSAEARVLDLDILF